MRIELERGDQAEAGERVVLSGNQPSMGNWSGQETVMQGGPDLYYLDLTFLKGTELAFKFTLGSWDREALTENGTIPENHRHLVQGDTVLRYSVSQWKTADFQTAGQVTGRVEAYANLTYPG